MNYFPNRSKYVSPRGFLHDLRLLTEAVSRAFGKSSHHIKGRKRLYASSLAFKTALALVPALAILMAVLSGDAFTQKREQLLDKIVDAIYPVESSTQGDALAPPEPRDLQKLKEAGRQEIHWMVNHFAFRAKKMGLAGLAAFGVVLFLLLRDVEDSFNFLWGVGKRRPFPAQLVRFGMLLVGAPLLAALLLTIRGWFQGGYLLRTGLGTWLLSAAVPFLCLWAVCAWMYYWIPNAKSSFKTVLAAGLLATVILESGQWAIGWYTLHVFAGSKIYGALWAVPVVLLWFYISWTIVLFGAEVAFFFQQAQAEAKR